MDIQRTDFKRLKRRKQILFGSVGAVSLIALVVWISSLDAAAPQV